MNIKFTWLFVRGYTVAQLVEALRNKPEGRGFDSRWCQSQTYFLEDKGGRCVGLTTSAATCAESLEICVPQSPGALRACPGPYRDCFTHSSLF